MTKHMFLLTGHAQKPCEGLSHETIKVRQLDSSAYGKRTFSLV